MAREVFDFVAGGGPWHTGPLGPRAFRQDIEIGVRRKYSKMKSDVSTRAGSCRSIRAVAGPRATRGGSTIRRRIGETNLATSRRCGECSLPIGVGETTSALGRAVADVCRQCEPHRWQALRQGPPLAPDQLNNSALECVSRRGWRFTAAGLSCREARGSRCDWPVLRPCSSSR